MRMTLPPFYQADHFWIIVDNGRAKGRLYVTLTEALQKARSHIDSGKAKGHVSVWECGGIPSVSNETIVVKSE
jgi:hypothetical protein